MVAQHRELHVGRQRGADAVGIDQLRVQPLRLEKYLVPVTVGKAVDLVLDRRAIARTRGIDRAGEQRRAVQVSARMMSWLRGLVRVIAQNTCGLRRCRCERRHRPVSPSEGCSSSRAQSIVRPSSRGGVPVLSRAIGKSRLAQLLGQPLRRSSRRCGRLRTALRRGTACRRGRCPYTA